MRYDPTDPELFVAHRKKLAPSLKPRSLLVLHANDIMPTNADGVMPFRQNSSLFYLSGIDQEDTILLLCPEASEEKLREVLFVRPTNERLAIWEGEKLSKEQASSLSGIATVYWTNEFDGILKRLIAESEYVYLYTDQHSRVTTEVENRNARFIRSCKEQYPLHKYERVDPLIYQLRTVKSPGEVEQIRKACEITERGFRRVLSSVTPGCKEYELEAEFSHEFLRNGSRGFAYAPIIASGANACVLHYIANDAECCDGDMLLLDVAAEYANYNADLTRTIPVNGRFTDRQRAVYNAVLRILRQANDLLRPGVLLKDYQKQVCERVDEALLDLGLISHDDLKNQTKECPARQKYFMHGCSHHLGLDVHDVCIANAPLEVGAVLTIEPGIYIRDENLGVRLENVVVVGENGNEDLFASTPIEADEIEALMNRG